MPSKKENVKLLCKSIVTRLENQKSIAFPPRLRQIVADEVHSLISPYVLTDEDIREKALLKMGASKEMIDDGGFNESDAFKTAKKMVRESIGDDELNGFYFVKPLKNVATMLAGYFMRSASIDEVYETDEDLVKMIIDITKNFNPANAH